MSSERSHARRSRRARDRGTALPRLTDRLTLGSRAAPPISPFCLGAVDHPDTVLAAFDAGINFFFLSADMHWPYYGAARAGLRSLFARGSEVRSRVVVGVVSYVTQPEFCWTPFEEVIAAVPGLDHIDVTIAGGAYGHEFGARLPVYRSHVESGHVGARAIGASFHDRGAAANAVSAGTVDIAFIRYNPGHVGARSDVFPHVGPHTPTRVYGFTSLDGVVDAPRLAALGLGEEYWCPDPTDYYRFALTRPEMDGVLCSLASPAQVEALASALERGALTDEEETYLTDLARLDRAAERGTRQPA
jgi:hypothetical protein